MNRKVRKKYVKLNDRVWHCHCAALILMHKFYIFVICHFHTNTVHMNIFTYEWSITLFSCQNTKLFWFEPIESVPCKSFLWSLSFWNRNWIESKIIFLLHRVFFFSVNCKLNGFFSRRLYFVGWIQTQYLIIFRKHTSARRVEANDWRETGSNWSQSTRLLYALLVDHSVFSSF